MYIVINLKCIFFHKEQKTKFIFYIIFNFATTDLISKKLFKKNRRDEIF